MDFQFSDSNKRYHTLDFYNKQKYNNKVFKVFTNVSIGIMNTINPINKFKVLIANL